MLYYDRQIDVFHIWDGKGELWCWDQPKVVYGFGTWGVYGVCTSSRGVMVKWSCGFRGEIEVDGVLGCGAEIVHECHLLEWGLGMLGFWCGLIGMCQCSVWECLFGVGCEDLVCDVGAHEQV